MSSKSVCYSLSEKPSLMTSLPDEIFVDIIARVPRSFYPTISLVSRRFRSTVASAEVYETRSLLGRTEHCLYTLLYNRETRDSSWYLLRGNDGFNRIPSLPTMPTRGGFVAVGSNIYVLDGLSHCDLTIDCRFLTVHPFPSPPRFTVEAVAGIVDRKVYAIGKCWSEDELSVMVFDTETQMWELEIKKLEMELRGVSLSDSVMMAGKIYLKDFYNSFVYSPKESSWELDEMLSSKPWTRSCVVDDILYHYDYVDSKLRAYDPKSKCWAVVKGVDRWLPVPISLWMSHTVSCGKKLIVFMFGRDTEDTRTQIWCAEIALEKCQGGEICGKVEWCDLVIRGDFLLVKSLAVVV